MSNGNAVVQQSPHPALITVRRAFEEACSALQAISDFEEAYRVATELADGLREMAETAALARARSAAQLSEAEGLSLAGLATKLSISKARASQLINAARGDGEK
ncbi:hypothetical protein ABGB18_21070 [Nonomuraea sp. B12E4]|uniref:hypothetical protein n=1 Tax=Nonomuraea sp. B12E4 TaxID=3153564 RepID=UPI00325E7ACE